MSEEHQQCAAKTKAGAHCKNIAMHGSDYCRVHQSWAGEGVTKPERVVESASGIAQSLQIENVSQRVANGGGPASSRAQTNFEILATQLNALASELQSSIPAYIPPAFTPDGLTALIKGNLDKFTPDIQVEILSELRRNLEGTTVKDLIDPDTWKGLWYILNYTAQNQSAAALEKVWARLTALPGVALFSDLKGNLAGTSPKEFLDPDTWKGLWLVMNYSIQATAADLKRKLDGEEEE